MATSEKEKKKRRCPLCRGYGKYNDCTEEPTIYGKVCEQCEGKGYK